MRILYFMILSAIISTNVLSSETQILVVTNRQELNKAVLEAKAGTKILITSGEYQGGLHFSNLVGNSDNPIIITAKDADNPPIIKGGGNCFQFSDCAYLEISNLILSEASGNGLNIDDGGSFDTPSHHIILRNLRVQDIGPDGNKDGIKLSGVDDFRVEDCIIERWGSGGSGIDMVGCHRGVIENCTFRYNNDVSGNAIQTKGGSQDIIIRRCRFENAGSRTINAGGSTGLQFFRPEPLGYEAKDITIEGCTFIGSMSAIAFVGIDGAVVRYNTIYRPKKWILRILQETRKTEFVPSRNGVFTKNIIAFRTDEVSTFVNIGSDTAPETFIFDNNLWYCIDNPSNSKPQLPTIETNGIYGIDPLFQDAENGNFMIKSESSASELGAHALKYSQ